MRKWLLWLCFGWLLCGASAVYANTWLIVGDSVSAAYGIPEEEGWVALLQERLAAKGIMANVVNASMSGDTTAGGVARLPALLAEHEPVLTVLELGGNDGLRGLPIAQMEHNLRHMIQLARAVNSEVLLLGMRIPPNYGQHYADGFYQVYQTLRDEEGVPLVDFFLHDVGGVEGMMQEDSVHPTAAAQSIMLNNVWPKLMDIWQHTKE